MNLTMCYLEINFILECELHITELNQINNL